MDALRGHAREPRRRRVELAPCTERTPHFCISETPIYVGRAVTALASDRDVSRWNGQSLSSGALAQVVEAGAPAADDTGYR